jgi:hypothetical protein
MARQSIVLTNGGSNPAAFGQIIGSLSPLTKDPEILFIYALADE